MENKIICRKCGGGHFTIKCGKEKLEPTSSNNNNNNERSNFSQRKCEPTLLDGKQGFPSNNEPRRYVERNERPKKQYFKKVFRVKLAELPVDMTENEMMELTYDWGHIVRLKVINYEETSVAYIDFGYEEEADYFVEALDKTTFDYLLLSVSRADAY
jgi:hypothetical protein